MGLSLPSCVGRAGQRDGNRDGDRDGHKVGQRDGHRVRHRDGQRDAVAPVRDLGSV